MGRREDLTRLSSFLFPRKFGICVLLFCTGVSNGEARSVLGRRRGRLITEAAEIGTRSARRGLLTSFKSGNRTSIVGPCTYKFSELGFSSAGPTGAGETNWGAFPWIRETREHFLLFVHKNFAYVIPKRYFAGEDDLNSFRALLKNGYKGKLNLLD